MAVALDIKATREDLPIDSDEYLEPKNRNLYVVYIVSYYKHTKQIQCIVYELDVFPNYYTIFITIASRFINIQSINIHSLV